MNMKLSEMDKTTLITVIDTAKKECKKLRQLMEQVRIAEEYALCNNKRAIIKTTMYVCMSTLFSVLGGFALIKYFFFPNLWIHIKGLSDLEVHHYIFIFACFMLPITNIVLIIIFIACTEQFDTNRINKRIVNAKITYERYGILLGLNVMPFYPVY